MQFMAVKIFTRRWNTVSRDLLCGACLLGALAQSLPATAQETAGQGKSQTSDGVSLTEAQRRFVSVTTVNEQRFAIDRDAVGTVDFDENSTVQVSPPYQGRISALFAKAGDNVSKGQVLFTIDSPDLLQAESTLLSSAGVFTLTARVLQRAKQLYAAQGLAQKDYDQAVSDQQAAGAAYLAARAAVRIFGKTDAQIDRILKSRQLDARMPVLSPISGQVTARNAAPGTLVQPGGTPVPFTVSNLSTKWLLGNVSEGNMPMMRLGQAVDIKLMAYPGRLYHGKISEISAAVDPNTHRGTITIDIPDPKNELRPQMLATFTVHTGISMRSLAVPYDGVVREGDGSMTVWVTRDGRHFSPRTVTIGLQQHGENQILSGLNPGERVAAQGALFLSNAYSLDAK